MKRPTTTAGQPRAMAALYKFARRYSAAAAAILGIWAALSFLTSLGGLPPDAPATHVHFILIAATKWFVWILFAPLILYIDRQLTRRFETISWRLAAHIPAALIVSVFSNYCSVIAVRIVSFAPGHFPAILAIVQSSWRGQYLMHLMIYFAIVGIHSAFDYQKRLNERKLETAYLERLVSETKLANLRAQLQPHFLFNTLNTISAHVEQHPRIARRILEQLGSLLRLSVEHSDDEEIPLRDEIAFLKEYCALQQARYEDKLQFVLCMDPGVLDALVPTFVFQPLVENSIRYGVAAGEQTGYVEVTAQREGTQLKLCVVDDGPGLPSDWDPELNVGIGIANTRERLRWLYGVAGQQFQIANRRHGRGARVEIVIPFHFANQAGAGKRAEHEYIGTYR